jgi:quercetin dioxygenase-like cupin family protein
MTYLIQGDQVEERDHPVFGGVKIKVLYSRADHGSTATIVLTRVPAKVEIPEHVHDQSDDILHVLAGRARMEIRFEGGAQTFSLVPGAVVRVPMNTPHRIFDVTEEIRVYDVFAPPAF